MSSSGEEIKLLSFLIPARNEQNYIGDCIKSILSENISTPYEIIVIDNASSDDTSRTAKQHNVRVVLEKKVGLSFARQRGFLESKGNLLVYIDADTRLQSGIIEKICRSFEMNHSLVALSPSWTYYDVGSNLNAFLGMYQDFVWSVMHTVRSLFKKSDFLTGYMMVIRKSTLEKVGGIDHDYPFYGEDIAISQKLHKYGVIFFDKQIKVKTSSRRYKRLGVFKTSWRYFFMYFMVFVGGRKLAQKFSKVYAYEADASH